MRRKPYTGKVVMDEVQRIVKNLQNEENRLMTKRSERVSTLSNFIKVINIASIVIAMVLAFYSITSFNRENKAKQEADKQAEKFRHQLEMRVEELAKVNTELLELRSIEKFAVTGRISRTIAHEVRNPLTNITLATEQLQETPTGQTDDAALFLDMIRRNAGRINQLVSDLLHSTRFAQLDFVAVDMNKLVDETLEMAKDRVELNHIRVEKDYDSDLCQVSVDAEKLKLALLNIIVNAIEAMQPEKGVLIIRTRKADDKCVIEIADNGSGIEEEASQKIFEPYFTSKQKGTGLGLTNTQNIILNHKGNISVKSNPGAGTSFFIYLNLN